MYRSTKDPVNNYVPTKVTEVHDLNSRLNKMRYDEIMGNLEYHFQNCYLTNFDKIHHERRGDEQSFSNRHYETIFHDRLNQNIDESNREKFISYAIKSERCEINFERKVILEHINRLKIEEELERGGAFLSAMRKKFLKEKQMIVNQLNFKYN